MSMLAINLPPPIVYLIQRFSIFGFIEGIFGKLFFKNSFELNYIDRYYRANYETASFISNQVLSVFLIVFLFIVFAFRDYLIKNRKQLNVFGSDTKVTKDRSTGHKLWDSQLFYKVKIFSFNIFSVLFPYLLLHSLLDITNPSQKNDLTKVSYYMSLFVIIVTLKLAFLITWLAIHNYINLKGEFKILLEKSSAKKKLGEDDSDDHKIKQLRQNDIMIYDNLFNNLLYRNSIKTHLIFWTKRISIILVIVISPYLKNTYTIITGFIVLLGFTSLELETRATNNKLEILYVAICAGPGLITSFVSMIMEGHEIQYQSKLDVSRMTLLSKPNSSLISFHSRNGNVHHNPTAQIL